jgi:hypothetical protein
VGVKRCANVISNVVFGVTVAGLTVFVAAGVTVVVGVGELQALKTDNIIKAKTL